MVFVLLKGNADLIMWLLMAVRRTVMDRVIDKGLVTRGVSCIIKTAASSSSFTPHDINDYTYELERLKLLWK